MWASSLTYPIEHLAYSLLCAEWKTANLVAPCGSVNASVETPLLCHLLIYSKKMAQSHVGACGISNLPPSLT